MHLLQQRLSVLAQGHGRKKGKSWGFYGIKGILKKCHFGNTGKTGVFPVFTSVSQDFKAVKTSVKYQKIQTVSDTLATRYFYFVDFLTELLNGSVPIS